MTLLSQSVARSRVIAAVATASELVPQTLNTCPRRRDDDVDPRRRRGTYLSELWHLSYTISQCDHAITNLLAWGYYSTVSRP